MSNLTKSELELQQRLQDQWRRSVESYEKRESQKAAAEKIPIEALKKAAQEKFLAKASSDSRTLSEFQFVELLRWFKLEFFEWVDSLKCSSCGGKTEVRGSLSPNGEELKYGAGRVENHFCVRCKMTNRFPRYNCPVRLLSTRRGRCGEWANCFTLLSRACNYDTRYISDETDHVWVEIFCPSLGDRWVHADPCENAFDKPLMYEKGWKKKLTYIFAISFYQVLDVTWRYSQNHSELIKRRTKYREPVLLKVIENLNSQIRAHNYSLDWSSISRRLIAEFVEFLNNDSRFNPTLRKQQHASAKEGGLQGRTTGSVEWRRQRGELGDTPPDKCSSDGDHKVYSFRLNPKSDDSGVSAASLKYCPSANKYYFCDCGSSEVVTTYGWHSCVSSTYNIYRKEEFDWKMVYLCRDPDSLAGTDGFISWKFEIVTEGVFIIESVVLTFLCKTYEDAKVTLELECMDASTGKSILKQLDVDKSGQKVTLSDCRTKSFTLSARLWGGQSDVWWQHAQLFRQPLDQPGINPFDLSINLKHVDIVS